MENNVNLSNILGSPPVARVYIYNSYVKYTAWNMQRWALLTMVILWEQAAHGVLLNVIILLCYEVIPNLTLTLLN